MTPSEFLSNISPPLDNTLAHLMTDEYLSLERRYFLRDWEPATLDAGQFCEIASRCLYHIDSGNLNRTKGVDECLSYVEDDQNRSIHAFQSRKDSLQLCRALRLTYKFRSSRGAVHIDPSYSANEMDARLVVEAVRWVMCELVRIFWTGDPSAAAQVVREIVRYRIPAVFRNGTVPVVQHTDLDTETEILLLLYDAGATGMKLIHLKRSIPRHRTTVEKAVRVLAIKRLSTSTASDFWILTDRGRASVEKELQSSPFI
jgi:hypothetical protein